MRIFQSVLEERKLRYRSRYGSYEATAHASLTVCEGGLAFRSSYDAALVAEFKRRIPPQSRRWDAANKYWIIDPAYGPEAAQVAERYLGIQVVIPAAAVVSAIEMRLLRVEYIGRTRDRGADEFSASGWVDGGWNAIFPENVLRAWFEPVPQAPGEARTLYGVLAISPSATEPEVKSAFRRLARQWHPDVCHEPDAAEQFKAINRAYEVLIDPRQRKKYDAGLALVANTTKPNIFAAEIDGYRSPLRCGHVLVEGRQHVGRIVVSKILAWEDIVDEAGRAMVVSWPAGATEFEVKWK